MLLPLQKGAGKCVTVAERTSPVLIDELSFHVHLVTDKWLVQIETLLSDLIHIFFINHL